MKGHRSLDAEIETIRQYYLAFFGNRLKTLATGTAKISESILAWLRSFFPVEIGIR
jgi:hypothetical protein